MKLVHCLSAPHIGGIERLVIELAIHQKNNGLDVSIMLDSREGAFYEYLVEQQISLIDSGVTGGFDFNLSTYKQLKKKFKKFDIVHLHSFSTLLHFSASKSGVKIVYTIHGLSKGVRKENKLKYWFRELMKECFLNKVDILIANSNYTLNLAKQHYKLKNTSSICILNGIRLPESSSVSVQTDKEFTIGLISRFIKRKGVDRLVKAFKEYKDLGGEGRLILVGDGVEFKNIQELVSKLELIQDVNLVGYSTEVDKYYRQFDLCVFPSEKEPFGLVAVEAYLHGKSVLALNDSGGLKEVVHPIEPENVLNDIDSLAERLLYWSKNRELLHANADKRLNYAKKNFSIERMANDYLSVYKKQLSKN